MKIELNQAKKLLALLVVWRDFEGVNLPNMSETDLGDDYPTSRDCSNELVMIGKEIVEAVKGVYEDD